MKIFFKIFLFSFIFFSNQKTFSENNINVIGSKTTVILGSKKNKKPYIDLTKEQFSKVLTQANITSYIPSNRDVGILTFRVFSPKKTKMYLKWDNKDSLYIRRSKEILFRRAGDYQSIHFNVVKPVSGYIYLMTSNDQLIRKIHYSVKKQNRFSQSIRFNISESETSFDDDEYQSSSLNYSIRQRSTNGSGRWSGNIGISENSNNSKSTSASVSYSW